MKSQNQFKYFLSTNVGTYGITKDHIATYVVAQYVCIKYLNILVFQDQIVFTYFSPKKSLEFHFDHIHPESSISQVSLTGRTSCRLRLLQGQLFLCRQTLLICVP